MSELKQQLPQQYQSFKGIYLTVNTKNPIARSCYLKSGFSEMDELFYGGAAGPQHIMKLTF